MEKRKHIWAMLLLIATCLFSNNAFAYDALINGIYYNFNGGKAIVTYSSTSYNSYAGDIVIPKSVVYNAKTYSVTSIGMYAFRGCSGLTSVSIPNSVISIGVAAFQSCSGLKKVIVPDIAAWCGIAFEDYESNPLYYAKHLYSDETTEITNLIIPNSVTSVGRWAFEGCTGLTSITIPNSVTSIGRSAFSGCSSLEKVIVPDIAAWCRIEFSDVVSNPLYYAHHLYSDETTEITNLVIPNSVTSIGDWAFRGCSGLTSVTIPNSVTSIGDCAFLDCSSLTSVTIPNSVTSIGYGAFRDGSGLTSLTIGNSVTSIGDEAFRGCSGLTSVTIGNSVRSISSSIFQDCSALTSVTLNSNALVGSRGYSRNYTLGDIFGQQVKTYILGDEVTSIEDYAFYDCSALTSVTIGNSVTSIGMYAFSGCSGLTSVTIPNSVTSMGQQAFSGCSGLEKVIVPDIGAWCGIAFEDYNTNPLYYARHLYSDETTEITNLIIPNSVTSIGDLAFDGCSSLTSITIPNSVTSIGGGAFSGCSGLTSVTIPNSVKSIESSAFLGCSGLTSVTLNSNAIASKKYTNSSSLRDVFGQQVNTYFIGEDVTSIGDYAFYGCSGLTSVNIPNSVTSIGNDAFSGCSSLTSVTLNNNALVSKSYSWDSSLENVFGQQVKTYILGGDVTSIGDYAFYECSALTSVTIPNSVTSIGNYAFEYCSGLTSVTIPNSVTRIRWSAFSACSSLEKVIVPDIAAWCRIEFYDILSNPLNCAHHLYSDETTEITNLTIPNSVTSIGDYAFCDCSGLTSVNIPNSVTSIGSSAFDGCRGLTSITIPNSVISIQYGTFRDCSGLTSVNIPGSVTSIGDWAFGGCSGLTSVTIPNSVTSIGDYAFYSCKGLTSVNIGNSVTSIGRYAFEGCSGLTSVTIGNSVKEIGYEAFADCAELTDVYCYAEKVPSPNSDAFAYSHIENATLHVPAASVEQYKATAPWSDFGTIVPLTDEDAIAEVRAVPVLIQTQGNTITVEGAEAGTEIILYGVNGVQLDSVVATTGIASLNASRLSGSVAIVKIGNKTVKVLMKQ